MKRLLALAAPLAVVVISTSSMFACKHEQAAPPPAPPVATVAPPPAKMACGPVGVWNLDGPNGGNDKVEVVQGDTPDTFIVKHHNMASVPGMGQVSESQFKVNMGASTAGLYTCKINDDCKTMSCGFGGAPAVMTRAN